MTQPCPRIALCKTTDVGVGQAIRIERGALTLAVFNLGGDIHVTDDACTHGPGSLSEGSIDGDNIICDFHGGAFNIRTGEVAEPPCMEPLKTYRTVVDAEGLVSIEV